MRARIYLADEPGHLLRARAAGDITHADVITRARIDFDTQRAPCRPNRLSRNRILAFTDVTVRSRLRPDLNFTLESASLQRQSRCWEASTVYETKPHLQGQNGLGPFRRIFEKNRIRSFPTNDVPQYGESF